MTPHNCEALFTLHMGLGFNGRGTYLFNQWCLRWSVFRTYTSKHYRCCKPRTSV